MGRPTETASDSIEEYPRLLLLRAIAAGFALSWGGLGIALGSVLAGYLIPAFDIRAPLWEV